MEMPSETPPELPQQSSYPVTFSVDYPDRKLSRLSTAFRIFWVIPIGIVLELLPGAGLSNLGHTAFSAGSIIVFPTVLMILFRKKYPRWWFDWNLELLRFGNRVGVYLALMDDRYPSTDEHQAVHLDFPYPDAGRLERGMPLVKWLLAIPHYFVLFFFSIGVVFAVIYAWFAILFTGRYPRRAFEFVEGTFRWQNRVTGYAFTLVTDQYPPFRLKP